MKTVGGVSLDLHGVLVGRTGQDPTVFTYAVLCFSLRSWQISRKPRKTFLKWLQSDVISVVQAPGISPRAVLNA